MISGGARARSIGVLMTSHRGKKKIRTQNPSGLGSDYSCLVRATGLEPAHRRYKILNLTCLPISPRPPFGAVKFFHTRPPFGVVKFFHTRPPFGARGIRAQKVWTLCASMHYCIMFSGFCQALFRYLYQLTEAQESVPLSLPHCTLIFPPSPLSKSSWSS